MWSFERCKIHLITSLGPPWAHGLLFFSASHCACFWNLNATVSSAERILEGPGTMVYLLSALYTGRIPTYLPTLGNLSTLNIG
ncbi:hypothetical protein B0H16DRAFT_1536632, partial [Mycena metata]